MTPERWKKIEDIFQSALDCEKVEREDFLQRECGSDSELLSEIKKLIARDEKEENFLESPVWTDSQLFHSTIKNEFVESIEKEAPLKSDKSRVGELIGVYRLKEEIGRGGMGVVYSAERDDGEFQQKVAIKLIKRGMDTDFIVKRFRHERQILARLNHPNIARLLDGGTTKDGLPYFVMEFIEGAPFLKYCEENALDLRQKLKLFLQICAAISHAHRRKVIHRDIKQSNILVTKEGEPKLLDFGIAKILDTESQHESLIPTATQMRLMTPEYASPEQVRGEKLTPASDQYSLGVLLYELLTGNRPYKFPSRSPHEIARVICEEIPSEPLSGEFGKKVFLEKDFQFDQNSCQKLDRIVLKTLQKNPSERYKSVEEFAADIERFLQNEEVSAEIFVVKENTNRNEILIQSKKISPRWKGIKQGIFATILSVIMIPLFLIMTVTAVIPPPMTTAIFLLMFFGGITRILYALFFESEKTDKEFIEAETKIIKHDTLSGNQTTAGQTGETSPKNLKRRLPSVLKYSLAALLLVSFTAFFYHVISNLTIDFSNTPPEQRWKNSFASTMSLRRLTTSGKVQTTAISPDGANIAFVKMEENQQSLWIRSTDSENSREIVATDTVFYTDVKFSPDNKWIYYIVSRAPQRTLYRIALTGGTPQKISENVYNLFAFSPDGSQIIYDNQNSDSRQHSLFIADNNLENGTINSARTLFVLEIPNYFPGGFAFSPDGRKIVYPRSIIESNKETLGLFVYDLTNNTNERLGTNDFNRIYQTAWRDNGEEIIISASENESAPHQLWAIDFPSGKVSRLTNDFSDYVGVNLALNSSALVTTKRDLTSNIWISELSASSRNFGEKIKQISVGFNRQDGFNGVNWTADNRILYVARAGSERAISLINTDGGNSQTLLTQVSDPKFPVLTKDSRYLIFADKKERELNIWRFDTISKNFERISDNYAVTPAIAANSETIYYSTLLGNSSNKLTIHRKSLTDESEISVTNSLSVRPVVSPDGKFIACNYSGEETENKWQIALLSVEGGKPRFIKPYSNSFFRSPQERPLAFSSDGKFLYFLNTSENIINIFRVSLENNAPLVKMTHFTSGEIFDFSLSPENDRAVLSYGSESSDIVMFANTLKNKNSE